MRHFCAVEPIAAQPEKKPRISPLQLRSPVARPRFSLSSHPATVSFPPGYTLFSFFPPLRAGTMSGIRGAQTPLKEPRLWELACSGKRRGLRCVYVEPAFPTNPCSSSATGHHPIWTSDSCHFHPFARCLHLDHVAGFAYGVVRF